MTRQVGPHVLDNRVDLIGTEAGGESGHPTGDPRGDEGSDLVGRTEPVEGQRRPGPSLPGGTMAGGTPGGVQTSPDRGVRGLDLSDGGLEVKSSTTVNAVTCATSTSTPSTNRLNIRMPGIQRW